MQFDKVIPKIEGCNLLLTVYVFYVSDILLHYAF